MVVHCIYVHRVTWSRMCEKTRVEKMIVEAEKAVAETREMVAQAKNELTKPLRKSVYLA